MRSMAYWGKMASARSSSTAVRPHATSQFAESTRRRHGARSRLCSVLCLVQHFVQLAQSIANITDNRDVSRLVLVEFRGINVDVNDLAVLGEFTHLACDAVVEADAQGQQEVGLADGVIGIDGAVHA